MLSPAEELGLSGAALDSRVRRAVQHLPDGTLAHLARRLTADARVNDVVVTESASGSGVGKMLLGRAEELARKRGCFRMSLVTAGWREGTHRFYERLGFRSIPLDEVTVNVERKGGSPAMLVRAGVERDLPAIAEIDRTRSSGARFALRRDPSLIAYALSKKRMLAGLGPSGLRQVEFFVAEEGASAVAYVILSENANGWTLEEAGDRDPAGARLGGMLQVLLAREPAHRTPLIRAWWPRAMPVPPQVQLSDRIEARDIFMARPLADVPVPVTPDEVFYWRGDYF